MAPFLLRGKRIKTNLRVKVRLQQNNPELILVEEITATVINVSKDGASLSFSRVFIDGVHLFFSTLGRNTHTLVLSCSVENKDCCEDFILEAQSIWMNSLDQEEVGRQQFLVGIEFLQKQNAFFNIVKKS